MGALLLPSFINLHFPFFLSKTFYFHLLLFLLLSSVYFLSFPLFPPVLFQQDPQNFLLLQHIQWSVTVILLFQVFPVSKSHCRWGGESEQEYEPMLFDSRAAPARYTPTAPVGEEGGSQIHITHESHLTPTGRNHGPWRKGNSRPQALGELLGDREALHGRWDQRMAGVFAQMELTDTYRHTDNVQLNVNTKRHEGKRHITEILNMTWLLGILKNGGKVYFFCSVDKWIIFPV